MLAYILVIVYIVWGLRKKSLKVKLCVVFSVVISIVIGTRLLYIIYSGDYRLETIFYPKIGLGKIAGGLIACLITIYILCKIFPKDKKEIYNSVIEALFLAGGFSKLNCHFVGCCYRRKN